MSFLSSGKTLDKVKLPRQLNAASFRSGSTKTPQPRTGQPSRILPSVNLLPSSTLEALAVRRVRHRLVAAGLVGAVLVGGGWMVQTQRLHSAEDRLAAEQALTPALNAQVAALAPVAQFFDLLQARKGTASAAMAHEVLFSDALTDLAGRTPAGIEINAMSVSLTAETVSAVAPPVSPLTEAGIDAEGNDLTKNSSGAQNPAGIRSGSQTVTQNSAVRAALSAADDTSLTADDSDASAATTAPKTVVPPVSCARPDPFNPAPIIGCVTLSGTAQNRAQVGQLVQNLRAADLYADPFITTTTMNAGDGSEVVAFAGSVGLTGKAVSGRYADLSWLSDPKVLDEAERMIKSGNTASHRLAERAKAAAIAAKAKADAEAAAKEKAERKAQLKAEKELAAQLQAAAAAAAAAAAQQQQQQQNGGE
ncbi:PilN domain-containing protein [Sporichthya polymorpha]|uniref:PilN domain-containing protein n=1 Tax=Sporichthya polymorpha TaxID=35751 RepID=UPI0003693DE1|nr:PilN domain-containing protein [Sporichthya polymorpha]